MLNIHPGKAQGFPQGARQTCYNVHSKSLGNNQKKQQPQHIVIAVYLCIADFGQG